MALDKTQSLYKTQSLLQLKDQLTSEFEVLSIAKRLEKIALLAEGKAVFTTSFGIEDQLLTHIIFSQNLNISLVTLDTGRLFPETYDLWQKTEEHYGKRIKAKFPKSEKLEHLIEDQGVNGFYFAPEMRKNCCHIRKVEPLSRAIEGANIWITGLRGDQSNTRKSGDFVTFDSNYNLVKVNPLFDFTREAIRQFTITNNVPVNVLHNKGFLSIGCAPCTRAIKNNEPERAGRWWWETETARECGLHVQNSKHLNKQSSLANIEQ